jgi:hypothetical protein
MGIIQTDDVLNYLEITEDPYAIADTTHLFVESYIPQYCNRVFNATDYKESYNGKGSQTLLLNNYPIISLTGVSLSYLTVVQIYNTNKYTTAFVAVTSTEVQLKYNGILSIIDLTFATNPTLTDIVAAVNSAGNGWVASVLSDYGSIISTELLVSPYKNAVNSNKVNLQIPYQYLTNYDCDFEKGILYIPTYAEPYGNISEVPLFRQDYIPFVETNSGDFNRGFNNIFVQYRAGYEDDDMPADLKLAALMMVRDLYNRQQEDSFGLKNYSIQFVINKNFDTTIVNSKSMDILNKYKRILL